MNESFSNLWLVVPAAGAGRRFGLALPKQYAMLAGKPVIQHTLGRLLALKPRALVVAVAPDDATWPTLKLSRHPLVRTVTGGSERADSVRLALEALAAEVGEQDWVLVHDVARPCITLADIRKLVAAVARADAGGILAAPVSDTLKQVNRELTIEKTLDRDTLWAAMTPQMFRFGLLREALGSAHAAGRTPTDEAGAMEESGQPVRVVQGRRDNIKITLREDLAIAETILRWQSNYSAGGEEE